jgi:hypothetical protein
MSSWLNFSKKQNECEIRRKEMQETDRTACISKQSRFYLSRTARVVLSSLLLVESLLPISAESQKAKDFKNQMVNSIKVENMGKSGTMAPTMKEKERINASEDLRALLNGQAIQIKEKIKDPAYAKSFVDEFKKLSKEEQNRIITVLNVNAQDEKGKVNEEIYKKLVYRSPFSNLPSDHAAYKKFSEGYGACSYYNSLCIWETLSKYLIENNVYGDKTWLGKVLEGIKKDDSVKAKNIKRLIDYIDKTVNPVIEKRREEIKSEYEKLLSIYGVNLLNGPTGHKIEQFTIAKISLYALALRQDEEGIKKLENAIKDKSSINLKELGITSVDFILHFGNNGELLFDGLKKAAFDEKGNVVWSQEQILKFHLLNIGQWKDGDSTLFQNNDKASQFINGYLSGNVVKNVSSISDIKRELEKILESGRLSSSFDAGLNYHKFVSSGLGLEYETIKEFNTVLILKQLIDITPSSILKNPQVLPILLNFAIEFQRESYQTLISGVSTADKEQLKRAQSIAILYYNLLPFALEKVDSIIRDGISLEKNKNNKPDYYKFVPFITSKIFEIIQYGIKNGTEVYGVPNLGGIRLSWDKNTNPLKYYFDNKKFPSDPKDIRALAKTLVDAISGECAVQQLVIESVYLKYNKENNSITAELTYSPSSRIIYDTNATVDPTKTNYTTNIINGFPGNWSTTNNLSEKQRAEYRISISSVASLKKDMVKKELPLPSTFPAGFKFSVEIESKGEALKPYVYTTPPIEIPAPEPIPTQIPFTLKTNIKIGGGIGGVPTGFDTRYGKDAYDYIISAYTLQKNADQNPENLVTANINLYKAIAAAYNKDPTKVGGDATKRWLEQNKDAINTGNFKTSLPSELLNSDFGSEASLVNIPDQLKLNETRTVNILNLEASKSNIYIKVGSIRYDKYAVYNKIAGYDDNGNPIFKSDMKKDKREIPLGGLGYKVQIEGKEKLRLELFGGKDDITFKTLSMEDKSIVNKGINLLFEDWEGNLLQVGAEKFVDILNLADQASFRKYKDRWMLQLQTHNLDLPLLVPLGWVGIKNAPVTLTWRSIFNFDTKKDSVIASLNTDAKQILELSKKSNKGLNWSFYEWFNGSPLEPRGLGVNLDIIDKNEVSIGIIAIPNPNNEYLDFNKFWKNNIFSGFVTYKFGGKKKEKIVGPSK